MDNEFTKIVTVGACVMIGSLVGIYIVAFKLDEFACYARWQDRSAEWSAISGCMIEYEGTMTPADRVWFGRD